MEPSDSPSFVRIPLAATPTAVSTCSFSLASTCSRASVSPVAQLVAWRMIAYDVPRPAIEPPIIAFSRPRTADFTSDLVGDSLAGCTAHQPESLSDLCVVDDFQEARSFELNGQRFAERAVKDGFAGAVGEIGEDQHVFVGERRGCGRRFRRNALPASSAATTADARTSDRGSPAGMRWRLAAGPLTRSARRPRRRRRAAGGVLVRASPG